MNRAGTSDPFVLITGNVEGKTPVVKKNLKPTCNYALPDGRPNHLGYGVQFEVRDEGTFLLCFWFSD